jgi:hypothetical protein
MWGTADAVRIRCKDGVLRVYDAKYGSGVPVEVERNTQLMMYGYGAVLTAKAGPVSALEMIIVQPRCRHNDGPVRRWRVDLIDAYDFAQDIVEAAQRTENPLAELNAGEWCRWCPAAGVCKAYEDYALAQAQIDFGPPARALPDPRALTNAEIGELLPKLSVLEEWITLIRHYAHAEAEAGRDIPGWKLVPKRGRRKWLETIAHHLIAELHDLGVSDQQIFNPPELKSPAQMEKLLPVTQRDRLRPYYETVSSGTVLAPDDDYREQLAGTGFDAFTDLPT